LIKRKGTQVSYQYLRSNMVEARGVEPLSENLRNKLSTSLSDSMNFPTDAPYLLESGR